MKLIKRNVGRNEIRSLLCNKSGSSKMRREVILFQLEKLIKKYDWDYKCIVNAISKSQKLYNYFKSKKRDRIKKFIVISHKLIRISKILSKKMNYLNIRKCRKEKLFKCKKKVKSVHSSLSVISRNDNTRKKIQEQLDLLRSTSKPLEKLKVQENIADDTISSSIVSSHIASTSSFENIENPLISQEKDQDLPIVVNVVGNFQEHFLIEDELSKINEKSFECIENDVNTNLNEFNFTNNENPEESMLDSTVYDQNEDCMIFNEESSKDLLFSGENNNNHVSDESAIKLPTKTLDIKKIKGWRSKNFLSQTHALNNRLLNENEIKKENDIVLVEEPLSLSDGNVINLDQIDQLDTDEIKSDKENKGAFESTFLDQFLSNSKLNISYQVPKLMAEDSISNPIKDEHITHFEANRIIKQHTTTKHPRKIDNFIKVKPKTLAEKRRLLEVTRQKDILHEMELNENTLLKQLKRISKKQKMESSVNVRELLLKQNIPISRECWMAAVKCKKIGTLMQSVPSEDDKIYIAGSYITEENISGIINETEIKSTEIKEKNIISFKSENSCSFPSMLDCNEMTIDSKPKLSRHSTYRPGPLSKKPDLIKEKLVNSSVVVRKMPRLFLEVFPEIGKPMHSRAEYYLKLYQENEPVISNDWALFAVSVLKHKNTCISKTNNSFIFPVNYSNNQSKILMKEHLINKPEVTCKINSNPIILDEVKQVMSDILDYLDTPKIDNSVLKYCPHYIESDKQEHTQNLNHLKVKDDSHAVIRTPKGKIAKSKVMSELKRLSVQFIEVNIDQKKLKMCEKPFCKLGCVCFDPSSDWPKHCGRESCMFECSCNSKFENELKPHHYVSLPEGVDLLSASTMGQLQNQVKRHLAKEERKFTQTVIKANDQTIVVGEGSRERKKRATKTPQKYNDYIKVDDDLKQVTSTLDCSVKQNIQSSVPIRKSIRIWNKNSKEDLVQQKQEITKQKCVVFLDKLQGLENVLPWCMVHNLYKCFCEGNMLEDALTSIDIKKNGFVKEEENDSNSFICYSSRRGQQNLNNTSDHRNKLCSRIYGVSSFYVTRNKSAYYKNRIAKIKEVEENSGSEHQLRLKSILQPKQVDQIEMDVENTVKLNNIKKDVITNCTQTTDMKSNTYEKRKCDIELLNSLLTNNISKNWLPDLCLPRPNMQSELRSIFRDFSRRHIFRVMSWSKLSIHFKQNTLRFWYNPSGFGAKLVITKHLNEKPFKFVLLKEFFKKHRTNIPEIVKGLLTDTLPGKATVDKDTYAILVYNGKHWEIRGTVISKNEKFAVPEEKSEVKNNSDSIVSSNNFCKSEDIVDTVIKTDVQDVSLDNKEAIKENQFVINEDCNKTFESIDKKQDKIPFDSNCNKLETNNDELKNKEIKNKNSHYTNKELNQISEMQTKALDCNISASDDQELNNKNSEYQELNNKHSEDQELNNKNSEDQQIKKPQYIIRTKKLSELTDISFETKEVPLTIAKPILSQDKLSPASIQVPIPISKRDCRWFMLILQDDFVMLRIKGSTTYIKYAKLKRAAAVATQFAKTLRVPIQREIELPVNTDPAFGMYAVPGLLERVFFGPYDLNEDHGILKYRYLNGELVTTKFMEQYCAPHQKSKGIWLYTQGEKSSKLISQHITMNQNIPCVDLTHEDNRLNNKDPLENDHDIAIFKCSVNNNKSTDVKQLPHFSNESTTTKKKIGKVNKRKKLGASKTSNKELSTEKFDKNNMNSELQINDNIDKNMLELFEKGTKPYTIKMFEDESIMPVLNNKDPLENYNDIAIIKCSSNNNKLTDNVIESTNLAKELITGNLKKNVCKVNKRKNLGAPKVSDEVFEVPTVKSDKNDMNSELQINENIDDDMPELIEEGTKPYTIKISKEEPIMPVLEPNVSTIKRIENKNVEDISKTHTQIFSDKIDIRSVDSRSKSKMIPNFKNPKQVYNEKFHKQQVQNEVFNKVNIFPIHSKGLGEKNENICNDQIQPSQNSFHNKMDIPFKKIDSKSHTVSKSSIIRKSPETDVWLISDPPGFGYISLKYIENDGYILHSPLSKQKKKFKTMKETLNWIDELLRKCLYFVPRNFQIRMYLIKDKKNLKKRSPLQEDQLRGYHMVCAKGLFDITTLTEKQINSFNLKSREKSKLLNKQKETMVKKLIYELGKTFLSDELNIYSSTDILKMACSEIKLAKEKNINLKLKKRDLAVHHNDLVDKLRTLRYQLRKNQESGTNKCLIIGNQKEMESKISNNNSNKSLMKNNKRIINSASNSETSKNMNCPQLNTTTLQNSTPNFKVVSTQISNSSKSNLKRTYSKISNDADCCIIIDSDDEKIDEKCEITPSNINQASKPNNEEKEVITKIPIHNKNVKNKKILLQGGSKFKIVDGKLMYSSPQSSKIANSQEEIKTESGNSEQSFKKLKSKFKIVDGKLMYSTPQSSKIANSQEEMKTESSNNEQSSKKLNSCVPSLSNLKLQSDSMKNSSEKYQSSSLSSAETEKSTMSSKQTVTSKPPITLQSVVTAKSSKSHALYVPFVLQNGSQILIPIESKNQNKSNDKNVTVTDKNITVTDKNITVIDKNNSYKNKVGKSKKFVICSKQIPIKLSSKQINLNPNLSKTQQSNTPTQITNNGTSILKSKFPEVIEID